MQWADPARLRPGCLPWLPEALRLHLLQDVRMTQQLEASEAEHWTVLDGASGPLQ
ncbi:hypothetical protein [Deinococcus piscis]|uniref:hypothetical protein n=1 Tax=Deinococcus piscis TaxID=394230 RepID=UPI0016765C06|nr:hypothetical protein [Deinococcus piscis]